MARIAVKGRYVLSIIILSTFFSGVQAQASKISPGVSCNSLGKVYNYSKYSLTCSKVNGKLIWVSKSRVVSTTTFSKINVASATGKNASSVQEVAPLVVSEQSALKAPYNKPIAIVSNPNQPDAPAPGRFCLNEYTRVSYNNEVLICLNGVWGRQLGVRLTGVSSTLPIESSKFISNDRDIERILLKDWARWKNNVSSNITPSMDVVLQDGYSKEWELITRSTISYTYNLLNANGLNLVQKPRFVFVEGEEERKKEYNYFYPTSACKPPYLANAEKYITIYCVTNDIASGGVRIGKPDLSMLNGYQLGSQDKVNLAFAVAHDLAIFFIVQAQYGNEAYSGVKYQIPAWIREGAAQLIGQLVVNDLYNKGGSYLDVSSSERWVGPKPESICAKDLQDAEGKEKIMPDSCSQNMNLYGVSLLAANHGGIKALFNFFKLYGESNDWFGSFEIAFNIKREDFYREWWSYLGLKGSDYPELLSATLPERY